MSILATQPELGVLGLFGGDWHKGGRMDLGGIGNECNRGVLYEILR